MVQDCRTSSFKKEWVNATAEQISQVVNNDSDLRLSEQFANLWQQTCLESEELCKQSQKQNEDVVSCTQLFRQQQQDLEADKQKVRDMLRGLSAFSTQCIMPCMAAHSAGLLNPYFGTWSSAAMMFHYSPLFCEPRLSVLLPPASVPLPSAADCVSSNVQMFWSTQSSARKDASATTLTPGPSACRAPTKQAALPLSLANALGIDQANAHDFVDGFVFDITLRVAEGLHLGLKTSNAADGKVLRIDCVLPGAAEAWNRQCRSTNLKAERVLLPGDQIVSVNGILDSAQAMLEECSSKPLLQLRIVRKGAQQTKQEPSFQVQSTVSTCPPSDGSTSREKERIDLAEEDRHIAHRLELTPGKIWRI
mmetsp:Transcript_22223/g.41376  ORF Transcript_22223/g.41376 Transcript_22223/m.41376 type:complete len:364 (+) Transcript_22223:63-1154(+)